ncbi:hypothetical protein MSEN_14770 [Mycolicibacter senuensis]|uniref:Uncharacterized protein n=1 Tax=Mycolicibacter senuensis TaxID=386913 RepID=A0A7I9XK59_9MYCO|nr:hypothetical protein MSEN_14770 [Mycolicibacter senuensis]
MWVSSCHSSGSDRCVDAEMVADSSNHRDGRLAPMPLITVATNPIRTASGGRRRRRGESAAVPTGARASTRLNGVCYRER